MTPIERLIVAIDTDSLETAEQWASQLRGKVGAIKLGLEFASKYSWAEAATLAKKHGLPVFMDAKLKDIPNTLAGATRSLLSHVPEYFTVMADNSKEALEAVVAARNEAGSQAKIVGVTVLTSIEDATSQSIYGADAQTKVRQFAETAKAAGVDAIVCSPKEALIVKALEGLTVMCPGVRPLWAVANDQARPTTPADAIKQGADFLIIGRPITQPPSEIGSPSDAIKLIITEIEEANSR